MTQTEVLIVTGPVGVGKTAVASEMADVLAGAGIGHLLVDVDALSQSFPPPGDDRFGKRFALNNLGFMWRSHLDQGGAARAILSVVLERQADLVPYQQALSEAAIRVIRLRAAIPTLQDRVRRREAGSGLAWHLNRARELAMIMDGSGFDDIVIDTDGRGLGHIASEALSRAGWL